MAALVALTACSQSASTVRITQDDPSVKPHVPVSARSEPVFYNGHTYQVSITPRASQTIVSIAGMTEIQSKDASGLGSSAFQHFSCRESQKVRLLTPPVYSEGVWNLAVKCA